MIRTRIAPSPTGHAHVGTARSALLNYIFTKQNNGKFILRIDDTDKSRSTIESEKGIFESLSWLGLIWDEGPDIGGTYGPYRQSEKLERYKYLAERLVIENKAYVFENSAIKIRAFPTEFTDLIFGFSKRNNIDDFIIMKSDGFPTYHFATVIDDYDMRISHVLRAQEHYENTFKQLIIYNAFGFDPPIFGHLPLLLNTKRQKISKRDGAVYVGEYKNLGYIPEAILNFLILLGWSSPNDSEILSIDDMINTFDISKVSKSNCIFEPTKLDYLNSYYIRHKKSENLVKDISPFVENISEELLINFLNIDRGFKKVTDIQNRIRFLISDEFEQNKYLENIPELEPIMALITNELYNLSNWTAENIKFIVSLVCENYTNVSRKNILMCLRISALGHSITPPLFESMELLGKEKCLQNLIKK